MQSRFASFFFLIAFFSAPFCFAQQEVVVETISSQSRNGVLEKVDSDGNLIGDGLAGINIEQLLSVTTGKAVRPAIGTVTLKLVGGGQLSVSKPVFDGEIIQFEETAAGLKSISMQAVSAILFEDNKQIREAVEQLASDEDIVIVAKESSLARVSGVLESFDLEKLQLNYKGKTRPVKVAKLAAIVVADLGLEQPEGLTGTVSLVDGSTLRGAIVGIDESKIFVELTGKEVVSLSREHFVRLDLDSDSIAYLSALEPVEVVQQPQFTVARPWRRNLSIEGNPIRLRVNPSNTEDTSISAIQTFENGIGTSSYSRIVFDNTKDFSRFLATVGIDVETEGRGDCEMRVEGDGITLWSARVRGNEPAVGIDVDISGISKVALIVAPGNQFDLADHANWARARFLKTE